MKVVSTNRLCDTMSTESSMRKAKHGTQTTDSTGQRKEKTNRKEPDDEEKEVPFIY